MKTSIRHNSLVIVLLAIFLSDVVSKSTKEKSLNDLLEMKNLIRNTICVKVSEDLRKTLFTWLDRTDGQSIPLKPDKGRRFDHIYNGAY